MISRARLAQLTRSGGVMRKAAEQAMVNIVVQALGAITTLSFVHLLPTHQYALFGLCVSTVNFISITSDLGLTASMIYSWRNLVTQGIDFAERYAAIQSVRRTLFAISGAIAIAVLCWLEYRQGETAGSLAIISILVLILSWAQINAQMIVVPLRLNSQLRSANAAELIGAVIRAMLAVLAFILALHQAWFPLISLGIAQMITWWLAYRVRPPQIRERRPVTREAMRSVLGYVIPTMPGSILFATQGLIVYWLASLSGGAVVVAQTFALGRLAAIFVTLNSIMTNVVIPHVVNLRDDRHAHRNGVIPIFIVACFCCALIGFSALFPEVVLFVLGKDYSGLGYELVLSLAAASLALTAQMLGALNRAMGWIRWETAMMIFHATVMLAIAPFFDFGTTEGVLTFNFWISVAGLFEMLGINLIGWLGIGRSSVAAKTPE